MELELARGKLTVAAVRDLYTYAAAGANTLTLQKTNKHNLHTYAETTTRGAR